ncbi:MAG: hypothetical protein ACREFG_10605, partial [Chthoniobacterales bacterium]
SSLCAAIAGRRLSVIRRAAQKRARRAAELPQSASKLLATGISPLVNYFFQFVFYGPSDLFPSAFFACQKNDNRWQFFGFHNDGGKNFLMTSR